MSKPRYADEAAFPRDAVRFAAQDDLDNTLLPTQWGLTKREYAAIQILAGMGDIGGTSETIALIAIRRADALLAELAK